MTIDPVELKRHDLFHNAVNFRSRERDEIRVAVHEGNVAAIRSYVQGISAQQHSAARRSIRPQQDGRAFEMPAAAVERDSFVQLKGFPLPEIDDGVWPLDPLPELAVQMDGCIPERMAPCDHATEHMGMRHCQA